MFWIAVFILAFVHFGLGLLVTLFAGLSNHQFLIALAKVLIFPSEQFPAWIQNQAWLSFLAYALTCLMVSLVICGAVRLTSDVAGLKAAVAVALVLPLILLGITLALANPPPDWNSAGHRYLKDYYFFLPHPIRESAEEKYNHHAIHQNLYPDAPYEPGPTGRWYWNYRPTLSGFPEYDAVVVASPVNVLVSREDFLAEVADQRAQGWRSDHWEKVEESDRWIMETALPRQDPVAAHERNRLMRVVAKQPAGGVWIGLVALQRKMSPEVAAGIVERAMDSVTPMSGSKADEQGTNQPTTEEAVSQLYFDLAADTEVVATRPDWIQPEQWDAYPARRQVTVFGPGDSWQCVVLLSDCSTRLNVFVFNPGPESQIVRVHAPGKQWMFTAHGMFVRGEGGGERQWTLTPSMPLPLPRDFKVGAGEWQLVQLAEMSPKPVTGKAGSP